MAYVISDSLLFSMTFVVAILDGGVFTPHTVNGTNNVLEMRQIVSFKVP